MNYTINLELQTYIPKNNKLPLRLRVSINGKIGYITLGRKIEANKYNFKLKKIKTGIKGYTNLNNYISEQEKILRTILQDAEIQGEVLTHSRLKEKYKKRTGKVIAIDLFEYIFKEIEYEQKYTKAESNTYRAYKASVKVAKKFKEKVSIYEVDKIYLEKLVAFLSNANHKRGKSYSENSIYGVLVMLRKYLKRLFDNGEIKAYPFKDYQIGSPTEISFTYLTPDELSHLHDLYETDKISELLIKHNKVHSSNNGNNKIAKKSLATFRRVLKQYLVSCYTGLRYSDMNLKKENIVGDYIVKKVTKGRLGKHKIVRIPIRGNLKKLLDTNSDNLIEHNILTNTTINVKLKDIAEVAGINKNLHFHTARHTFATISLILGMRLEIIKDILGHSDVKMTLRYAHIVDKIRDTEMDKWDTGLKKGGFTEDSSQEQIICPKCKNLVLSLKKHIIKLKTIPIECFYCENEFLYKLDADRKIISMRIV